MALEEELAASKARLGEALSRLEKAVEARINSGDTSEEVARLSEALAAADRRNRELSGQSERVVQSLDKTIRSLNSILEA